MTYLTGKCLISMPRSDDDYFSHSLIYVCSHNQDGAFGFIVNKTIDDISFNDLSTQLATQRISTENKINLHHGGPLEKVRGFVLHSTDYIKQDTIIIDNNIAISSSIEILNDIATGDGPQQNIIALGYASWAPMQLEDEIKNNVWLIADANLDLVFNTKDEDKWQAAIKSLGFDVIQLSPVSGNA